MGSPSLTRLIPLRYDGQRCPLPAHLHELYGAGADSPSCPHRGQPGLPPVTASHTPRAAERPYILPRMRGKTNETGAGLTFLSLYVPVGGGQPRFRRMTKSSPAGTAASALLRPGSTRGGRPCCHYAPVSVEPGRYSRAVLFIFVHLPPGGSPILLTQAESFALKTLPEEPSCGSSLLRFTGRPRPYLANPGAKLAT